MGYDYAEKKLNELIKKRGRGTATKLAEYLSVPLVYVSRWQKGSYKIPKEKLPQIAKFFNIDISEFFKDNKIQHNDNTSGVPYAGYARSAKVPLKIDSLQKINIFDICFIYDGNYFIKLDTDLSRMSLSKGDYVLCNLYEGVKNGDYVHYTIKEESGLAQVFFTKKTVLVVDVFANTLKKYKKKDIEIDKCFAKFKASLRKL